MKRRLLTLVMVGIMIWCCGCSRNEKNPGNTTVQQQSDAQTDRSQDGQKETFKIGVCIPLSGVDSAHGTEARKALELAEVQINEAGGFNGIPIELVIYDDQNSAEEAVKVTTRLIEVENVDAYIGSVNSSEVLAVADYLTEHKIYSFGMGTSATWMRPEYKYLFRAVRSETKTVPLTVDIAEKLGFKKIAVFHGQDDASIMSSEAFMEECKSREIEICAQETFDSNDTDFSAQVASMIASEPDTVYIATIASPAPVIVSQLRQYGYDGIILDRESFMTSQIDIAGEENSNYIAFAIPYVTYESIDDCEDPYMKSFLQEYMDMHGELVKCDSAYRAYDTIMAMWEASKIAGKNDAESLREATNQISGLQALGGTLDFTNGDREGYGTFGSYILIDRKNIPFDQWLEEGGYEAYKAATGNEK